jgi:hypothetical protein
MMGTKACMFTPVRAVSLNDLEPADHFYCHRLHSSRANNGWFSAEDTTGDGTADLPFIKTHNTTSGTVEFFVANGSGSQQLNIATTTWLSPNDANNGWFLVASRNEQLSSPRFRDSYAFLMMVSVHPSWYSSLRSRQEQSARTHSMQRGGTRC